MTRPAVAFPALQSIGRPLAQAMMSRLYGCIEVMPAAAFVVNLASTAESAARKYLQAREQVLAIHASDDMNLSAYVRAVNDLEDAVVAAHRATQFAVGLNREVADGAITIVGRKPALASSRDREAVARARHAVEHLYDRLDGWDQAWSLIAGGDRLWVHGWEVTYAQLHSVTAAALDWADACAGRASDTLNPKVTIVDEESGERYGPEEAAAKTRSSDS